MTTKVAHVPVLSPAHAQAVALVTSKQVTLAELATVVEVDPTITMALLRFANSALDAPLQPVVRASDAIVRLGLEDTRRVLLGIVMSETAGSELEASGLDEDELWRHLVGNAIVADALTSVDPSLHAAAPLAFGAGLLHDIGRLALAASSPPHYQRVRRRVAAGTGVLEAEQAEFNTDHQALGLEIAAAWSLPPELHQAIGAHHTPSSGVADAVYRARRLVARLGIGDGLTAATAPTFSEADDDAIAVMHAGGAAAVNARIDWFRGALPR